MVCGFGLTHQSKVAVPPEHDERPAFFIKGFADTLKRSGDVLCMSRGALSACEEAEVVALFLVSENGQPDYLGYTFGNPWRMRGHTFPGGTDPGGRGIASTNLTAAQIPKDANGIDTWWDFANPGDLYTTTPNNQAGADITAVFDTPKSLHAWLKFVSRTSRRSTHRSANR